MFKKPNLERLNKKKPIYKDQIDEIINDLNKSFKDSIPSILDMMKFQFEI